MTKLFLTVKTDDVTSGTRDVDSQGQLRAVQGRMGKSRIFQHLTSSVGTSDRVGGGR